MGVIKCHKRIYCDICGKDIRRGSLRYRYFCWINTRYKHDLCEKCHNKFREYVKNIKED